MNGKLASLAVVCAMAAARCSGNNSRFAAPHASERLSLLQSRLAGDTNDPVAYYNVALGYWSHREYDRADSNLATAVALDPEFALAHLAKALVQLANDAHWKQLRRSGGDTAVAQEARYREREYARAFMIDPFLDVQRLGLLTESYEKAYEDLNRAMDWMRDRQGRRLDSMPRTLVWLHAIAAVHTNHLDAAIVDVQSLGRVSRHRDLSSDVSPTPLATNNYLYLLAALLQRTGHTEDATWTYIEVATGDIANYEAHVQLARIYEAAQDWTRALEQRRAAVDVYPENQCLVMDLGVTQYRAGMLPEAEATLRDAQAAGPRDPRILYWLGIVQRARNEKSEAQHSWGAYLQLAPRRDSVRAAEVRQSLAALE